MRQASACIPLLLAFSCAGQRPASESAASPAAAARAAAANQAARAETTPPTLRLPDIAEPTRYALELTVLPGEPGFEGTIDIALKVRRRTSVLWLNASELTIGEATLAVGGARLAAQLLPGGDDFVGFAFDEPVAPGAAVLHLAFKRELSKKDMRGLYQEHAGGDWYAFTQFEPTGARHAFPCFDEPAFKVPWKITLRVRQQDRALSNAPAVLERSQGGGLKTVAFADTQPLPSYLVALAVGPFELVDAGRAGKKETPIRIITPRGQTAQARYAAETTPVILTLLENYFEIPFPYDKLDLIADPLKGGAMENPGLVTFGERSLLARAEDDTLSRQRGFASTCAHELAHMWFGDLVTTAWWDDLWLNEAFASWMADKIIAEWRPRWDRWAQRMNARARALGVDSLASARKIRQPIASSHDIANAFDAITYQKGAAVIGMFERFVGPEKFRRGVQGYLREHAWKSGTAAEFLGAIDAQAGRSVAPAFSSFLDQPGIPEVTVELRCQPGRPPELALAQRRYLPLGSTAPAARSWQIPICARYPAGSGPGSHRDCMLLEHESGALELTSASRCPAWVLANADEAGYYTVRYPAALLRKLFQQGAHLTLVERMGLVSDAIAEVRAAALGLGEALELVPALVRESSPHLVTAAMDVIGLLAGGGVLPEAARPHFAAFVRATFGPRAQALGFHARRREDEETRLLRPSLVLLVGDQGEDPALRAQARELGERWLEDPQAVEPDMVDTVLALAAVGGDRALFDRIYAAAKREPGQRRRRHLLGALGRFRAPELARAALALTLGDDFDARESGQILTELASRYQTRDQAYRFVKSNFDAYTARRPRDSAASLPGLVSGFCSEAERADVAAFFQGRVAHALGGPRALDQALERIHLCAAFQQGQSPGAVAFLESY